MAPQADPTQYNTKTWGLQRQERVKTGLSVRTQANKSNREQANKQAKVQKTEQQTEVTLLDRILSQVTEKPWDKNEQDKLAMKDRRTQT